MGRKMDVATRGVNVTVKVFVSALWAAAGIAGFATGLWWFGLLAIAYLVYLWFFGGRWLIY
jgi:hypothetical protein